MNADELRARFAEVCTVHLPLPGGGETSARHRRLMEVAREDVSLAKLAEAHWDALAILAEAGREPAEGALYAVWASEIPGRALTMQTENGGSRLHGVKQFCTGAGLVDRALMTVEGASLVDVDLRANAERLTIDGSAWKTQAFAMTGTCAITFDGAWLAEDAVVGRDDWYVQRPGFWHGACGPAACWAGGAAGLVDFAMKNKRDDPHTLAHLGAMRSDVWAMQACLEVAGREIDAQVSGEADDTAAAQLRALQVRHVVEQASMDILRRFARAYGPAPLAMDETMSRRFQETELYLRQCHGERDLEALGRTLRAVKA